MRVKKMRGMNSTVSRITLALSTEGTTYGKT